jgi:hypothetical protein
VEFVRSVMGRRAGVGTRDRVETFQLLGELRKCSTHLGSINRRITKYLDRVEGAGAEDLAEITCDACLELVSTRGNFCTCEHAILCESCSPCEECGI